MSFKDQVAKDNSTVFMNSDDFAELHNLNGRDVTIVIDNDELKKRQAEFDGDYIGDVLIYVPVDALPAEPKPQELMRLDNRQYTVESAKKSVGMYEIVLSRSGGFGGGRSAY